MINRNYLIFTSDFSPGGISNMLAVHTLALLKLKYSVTVLLPKDADAIRSINCVLSNAKIKNYSLNIIEYNKLQFYSAKLYNSSFFCSIFKNVDVCFIHNARLITFARKYTKKLIYAINHTGKKTQIKFYKQADFVLSVNKKINEDLISNGIKSNKCKVCPNCLAKLPVLKDKIKNTNDVIVIGAIGRLVQKKGFDDFINAMKILKSQNIKFVAYIAGDGELYSDLEKSAEDIPEVKFLGWVSDKYKFYSSLDILCQPSHFEPFGLTVIEAMSYGLPVISTSCDGPKEIIDYPGENGFIVDINKPEQISEIIEKLIYNSKKRNDVGVNARKHIENNYTIESLQKNLSKYLK